MDQVAASNVGLGRANQTSVASKLALDQVTLATLSCALRSPGWSRSARPEPGQLAGPGVAIFTLDDLDHVWLRAYVNEPDSVKSA